MFELNLFNFTQVVDQLLAFICVFLLTSLSAKTRYYGFAVGLSGAVPSTYLLMVSELWWLVACMPIWVYISIKGMSNNWREYKGLEA